jgi:hypothetical protein
MAALAAIYDGTATISIPVEPAFLTSPRTQVKQKQLSGLRRGRGRSRRDTGPEVDPYERGDEEERNQAAGTAAEEGRAMKEAVAPAEDGEAGRVRSEVARDLIRRVDDLLPLVGDVALATNLQLLKRDLSRCHDVLRGHPGESDFLSIVVLAESAMAQLKWKQYTRPQLEAIRQVFEIGYRQVQVGFEDYEKARSLLCSKHVEVTPRIDLESLKLDDISDEEEG